MKQTTSIFASLSAHLVILSLTSAGIGQGLAAGISRARQADRPRSQSSRQATPGASSVFGSAQGYAAGFGGASQAVAGDFNADGSADLAVLNPCNSSNCGAGGYASVAVLTGNGDGTFQSPAIYALGTYEPMSMAVGDFNGDGVPDLAVASQCTTSVSCGSGVVSLLLSNGDGTFQTPVPYAAGAGASYFVATGDFNGDGHLDLAVANQTSAGSTVSILLGNGDGTFQAPLSYSTGAASATFLAVGDFNNDGMLDVAVANGGNEDSVSILLGNGDGSLQNAVLYASGGANVHGLAAGDFNGDGEPDLAVVNGCATTNNLVCSPGGSIGILLGNGDGTFQPPVSYGSGAYNPSVVAVADFDGDGHLDLAVQNVSAASIGSSAGVLSLLLGNGDGTFQPAVTFGSGGSFAASVWMRDFNLDGRPDLAVVNQCPASGACSNAVAGVLMNTAPNFTLHANSISLTSAVNPSAPNQSVLLTATVIHRFDAGEVTGDITFYDGSTPLSTATVSNGQAVLTTSFVTPGAHALQAAYSGDTNYSAGTSAIVSEIVGTPVALNSSLNPSPFNQAVSFTATVNGNGTTPTGSLTFIDGTNPLGTFPLIHGSATVTTSALTLGSHTITASYGGSSSYPPGSATLAQAVSQTTATTLTSSANPASTNQPITFTATVTPQYGGAPHGVVAFMQGSPAVTWGTAMLIKGQASISNQFNKPNSYPITAVFLGSPDYQSSTSTVVNQVINGSQIVKTTTTLASSGSPSIIYQPVTFTATISTVSGQVPDGEAVTFYSASNTLGTSLTANGTAAFTTSSLPVGSNSITATYAGDATYQSSTSHAFSQVVEITPTNTSITASLNPSTYGESVTFDVAVTSPSGTGTPAGAVTLNNGTGTFGKITLNNGVGSFTTSTLPGGSLSITASYTGNMTFATSSASISQTVNMASTTTALTATPNPSSVNQTITLTATVTSQCGGQAGGTVMFKQGATTLGTASVTHGKATATVTFSATGTYPVVARYSGDSSDYASPSAALDQIVNAISTTTVVTSSGTPSLVGQTVKFTATVTPESGAIPNGERVTFYDGSASLGTGTTVNGVVSLATSILPKGTHFISATYAGDADYQTNISRTLNQVVNLNLTNTLLQSSANPSDYGEAVVLTATVLPLSGSGTPTGIVTFKNGTTTLGQVGLINGVAALSTRNLTAGSQSLSVSYPGDATFANSSVTLTQVVHPATTVTALTSNHNPSALNQNVTFTAIVTGEYSGTITGSVSFMQGSKLLGSGTLANGRATFTFAFTTAGTQTITAVYAGDGNNRTSTSPAVDQVVN